jgi:hypothetical protein
MAKASKKTTDKPRDLQKSDHSIFNLLTREHRELSKLMERIETTEDEGTEERSALFAELRRSLLSHAKAEERVVYERFARSDRMAPRVLQAREEHGLAEHVLEEMGKLQPSDERWFAKFCVLRELVEHHIEEEEAEQFKIAKRQMDDEESARLAKSFLAAKEELLRQMSRGRRDGDVARPELH